MYSHTQVLYRQSVAHHQSLIARWRVVRRQRLHPCLLIKQSVLITSFIGVAHRRYIIYLPDSAECPYRTQTTAATLTPIAVLACCEVFEVSIRAIVVSRQRECKSVAHLIIYRRLHSPRVSCRVLYGCTRALIQQRRHSIYIHLTSHRITTIECTLWATQELHTLHIQHIEVVIVLVQIWHSVDQHTYHRLVDTCSKATHIYRRCHL